MGYSPPIKFQKNYIKYLNRSFSEKIHTLSKKIIGIILNSNTCKGF